MQRRDLEAFLLVEVKTVSWPLEYSGQPPSVNSKEDVPIFQEWSKLRREAAIGKAIGGFVLFVAGLPATAALGFVLGPAGIVIGIAIAVFGIYLIVIGYREDSRVLKLRKAIVEQASRTPPATVHVVPGSLGTTGVAPIGQLSSLRPCPYCSTMNQRDWAFCQKCAKPLPPPL